MKNAYVCYYLHVTVTEDRDNGVTPMFIGCPQCSFPPTMAKSMMYQIDQDIPATHEWYYPTPAELRVLRIDLEPGAFAPVRDHVQKGGLLLRAKNQNQ